MIADRIIQLRNHLNSTKDSYFYFYQDPYDREHISLNIYYPLSKRCLVIFIKFKFDEGVQTKLKLRLLLDETVTV